MFQKKSIWPFLSFSEKGKKIETFAKFIIEEMFRNGLAIEIKNPQTNKTFMASNYNFNWHLVSFEAISFR